MRKGIILMLGTLLCCIANSGVAQETEDYTKLPGYFNLDVFSNMFSEEEPVLEVKLRGALLRMAAGLAANEDPEAADALMGIKLIRVEKYALKKGEFSAVKKKNRQIAKMLEKKGWEQVARVREKDEQVFIHVKTSKDKIVGLVVASVGEDNEAVFVNIVGKIDPDQMARLGKKWDIQGLDSLQIGNKKKEPR